MNIKKVILYVDFSDFLSYVCFVNHLKANLENEKIIEATIYNSIKQRVF